ncbi:MAG: hypothetical protein ACFE0I_03105 [Elainellaceae cyanobacterium]
MCDRPLSLISAIAPVTLSVRSPPYVFVSAIAPCILSVRSPPASNSDRSAS